MGSAEVDGIYKACLYDLCASENKPTQSTLRCNSYSQLNSKCLNYAKINGLTWNFNWRTPTNCRNKSSFNIFNKIYTHIIRYILTSIGVYYKPSI